MKTIILNIFLCAVAACQSNTYHDASYVSSGTGTGMPWFYNTSSAWYGSMSNFRVGDGYHITIGCEPYAAITVTRWQNGQPASTLNLTCGPDGYWIYDGVVQQYEIGFWTESWVVDGDTWPMLQLTIWPYGGPPNGQTVFFVNQTTGNSDVLRVGDQYYFLWYGPPYATMARNGVKDGNTLAYPSTWQLDGNGVAYYYGTVQASEVGVWTEAWTANGVPSNVLHFQVLDQ